MKHIKKFENVNKDFIFAVDITNITSEYVYQLEDKILSEFPNFNKSGNFDFRELILQINVPQFKYNKPWALVFDVHVYTISKSKSLSIQRILTPGWGSGVDYMKDIISLDEFLNIEFSEVEEYIDVKKQSNKYNL